MRKYIKALINSVGTLLFGFAFLGVVLSLSVLINWLYSNHRTILGGICLTGSILFIILVTFFDELRQIKNKKKNAPN